MEQQAFTLLTQALIILMAAGAAQAILCMGIKFKPFSCGFCLGFWLTLITDAIMLPFSIQAVTIAILSALAAAFVSGYLEQELQ